MPVGDDQGAAARRAGPGRGEGLAHERAEPATCTRVTTWMSYERGPSSTVTRFSGENELGSIAGARETDSGQETLAG